MIGYLVLGQMLVMMILIITGVLLFKFRLLDDEGASQISSVLLKVCTPLIIIDAMNIPFDSAKMSSLVITSIITTVLFIVFMTVASLIFSKHESIEKFSALFSNAGFIGIPLVINIMGPEFVFILSVFILISNLFAWTVGLSILRGDKRRQSFINTILNPVVLASFLGVLLFMSPFTLPKIVAQPVSMIAGINSVLAMLVLGCYVSKTDFISLLQIRKMYKTLLVRLLIFPLLLIGLLALLPGEYLDIKRVILIAYSAPIGVIAALFSKQEDLDYIYAAGLVSVSTLCSVVTIPLILMISSLLW